MNDLVIPARLSWEQWVSRLHEVGNLKKKLPWYVGDLLNYGVDTFGEKAWQEIEELGYSEGALANLKSVAKKIPAEERSAELPWSWYAALCPLPKREREKAITQALAGELNRAGIRALVASRNGDGTDPTPGPKDAPQTALDAALRAFGAADVLAGKLAARMLGGEACNALLADALDELIAEAMTLKEKLK